MISIASDDGEDHKKEIDQKETKAETEFSWVNAFPAGEGMFHENQLSFGKERLESTIVINIDNHVEYKYGVKKKE